MSEPRWKNPFTPAATRPSSTAGVFGMSHRGPQTTAEISVARNARERGRPETERIAKGLEHIEQVPELHDYLSQDHPDQKIRKAACAHLYDCNPWMYESFLLDDLVQAREHGASGAELKKLRGLIRTGSWNYYERITQGETHKIIEIVEQLRAQKERDWDARIQQQTAPEKAADMIEQKERSLRVFDRIEEDLLASKIGPELEDSARAVESMNLTAWLELKKTLATHGLTVEEARKTAFAKPLLDEIESFRKLRDFIYFRTLYPNHTRIAFTNIPTRARQTA